MNLELERSYPTPFANSSLLPLLLLSLASQKHSPDPSTEIKEEYDYVIVGAGAAGSVVASRLSEIPCVSVLLLEAGPRPPLVTDIPAIMASFWGTDLDWQYQTAPQEYTARALVNRKMAWPAGKAIGGSSAINTMFYVRGNRKDYDDWEVMGAKGWSYNEVFPYFLKLEDNQDPKFLANGYHARGGPVTVHQPRYRSELRRAMFKAAIDLGYEVVDVNAERQTGIFAYQANLRNSQRCSTAKAYLVPAENRTNLDILPNAMVTKVIIHKKRATGVQFDYNGYTYNVKAKREVIMSAGSVNTAKLLLLSGVGPKRELQRLNIPVQADLPVGENLHDHAATLFLYQLDPNRQNFLQRLSHPDSIRQYIHNRTGPLGLPGGNDMVAFLKGEEIRPAVDSPNYELNFAQITASTFRDQMGLIPEIYRRFLGPYENSPLYSCFAAQVEPRSRGTIKLRSNNPYDSPVINPNYLKDPRDVEDMVQAMKACRRLLESKHVRKLGVRSLRTLMPGCEKYANDESNYFRCYLRSFLITVFHPVGTAKMGDTRDPTTVVDSTLKVKNIKGLRVVDASVMPKVVTGNTHVPTIMIAEKASDIIKDTISCYKKHVDHWGDRHTSVWSGSMKDGWNEEKKVPWDYEADYEDEADYEAAYHDGSPKEETWIDRDGGELRRAKQKYEDFLKQLYVYKKGIFSGKYTKHPQEYLWPENEDNRKEIHSDFPHLSSWEDKK